MKITDLIGLFDEVVDSYELRVPTYVNVSKKNQKAVNLNVYRNLHHHHLNAQKKNFTDEVMPLLRDKPRAERIWIHYTIFTPSNRRIDTMNVGSITDKYFSDTMVEAGKIPDDNSNHIVLSTFSFGGVIPMGGHAIATIYILKPKQEKEPEKMRILLDQDDIQNALNAYVKTLQFPNADKAEVDLSIEDDEIVAEVIIGEAPVKNRGGRPRKLTRTTSTQKAEVTEDASETDSEGSSNSTDSGSSDESTSDTETGTKKTTPAEKESPKGNPFGDEEIQSSDSKETTEDSSTKGKTVVKPAKKASIFDVD